MPEYKAGLAALVATILGVALVVILRKVFDITDSATTIALLLIPLLVSAIASGHLKEFTAPGGWGAKFAEEVRTKLEIQEQKTEEQRKELERQEKLIGQIVSNLMSYIHYKHLWYIGRTKEYIYRDNDNFRREMILLQDMGFIRPSHAPYLNFSHGEYSLIDKDLSLPVREVPQAAYRKRWVWG